MPRPMTTDMEATPYAVMEQLDSSGVSRFLRDWVLKTPDTLEDVLTPGYFDTLIEIGFMPFDRIETSCAVDTAHPQHALLVVDSVGLVPNAITVSVLRHPPEKTKRVRP